MILQFVVNKVYEIYYTDLLKKVKTWIIEHSYKTIFHIVNEIVFFYLNLVIDSVFWSLQWTSTDSRADKQSSHYRI